ncbi:MAG TPA: nicotinate-nucleotide--dimethylbenzimidazole phosphoribosyltransferase [Rectinemataceae bacterium]|nr:nicotinate-nucleotide--dimethylbenzimidazole phosphoribosyltransferase [Rectinemataceae bacterium]
MNLLETTIARIRETDRAAAEAARSRQDSLTKPRGSLGLLEDLSVRIAGIVGTARPSLGPGAVFVMAGDHGVCAEGVSAFPQEVTPQMVHNFLAGGAGINVLARWARARVVVTDVGVASDIAPAPGLYIKKIARGTANMATGPAMSRDEARRAVEAGIEVFEAEYAREPFGIAATGDMGIGNTTPSTALASVFTGVAARDIVGRGTGIDDAGLARKLAVIERALAVNRPDAKDALGTLASVGGFEIGAIAGVILAAAARRMPVLIDGFISGAGALVARGLAPLSAEYMIAAHASAEAGHRAMLTALGLKPLLDLGLRLGEGTGAALALGLCDAACRILDEMATFGEAGVSDKKD